MRSELRAVLGLVVVIFALGGRADYAAAAAEPGSPCPGFTLPWLDGDGAARLVDLYSGQALTVLVVWSRACDHCAEVALGVDDLAEWLAPYPARAVPILFGPDDPIALRALLSDHDVATPHLWDANGAVAAALGLGDDHLRVVIVDSTGVVEETIDSSIRDLVSGVAPGVIAALDRLAREPRRAAADAAAARASAGGAGAGATVAAGSGAGDDAGPGTGLGSGAVLRVDARARAQQTERARRGDVGLYGEPWENGTLLLTRWDLRLRWPVTPAIEVVPWLRVSNEDESVLTEGPEQIANAHGSLSVNARTGVFSGTLGAFPLRVSPFLLQRWDADDAPPLGGSTSCAVCGAGVTGVSQKSLEVLGPEYTFEGVYASASNPRARLAVWGAVPRWERLVDADASAEEVALARYRRTMTGVMLDLGRMGGAGGPLGLPRPVGFRVAYVSIGDDRRSVPSDYARPLEEYGEYAWTFLGQVGPYRGLSADAEQAYWQSKELFDGSVDDLFLDSSSADTWALRAGVRGAWTLDRYRLGGRAHHIRTEPDFAPLYRALTYEANRKGWRFAASVDRLHAAPRGDALIGASVFYRDVRETEPTFSEYGRAREKVLGISITANPWRRLETGAHFVRTTNEDPHPVLPDRTSTGYSFDAAWTGWSGVDPLLRLDVVRPDPGSGDERTLWQGYLMVRAVR